MQDGQAVNQQAIDAALIAFYRYKIGELRILDLERAMSFEVGDALSRSGLVRITITRLESGRYRLSDKGEHAITDAGRARLEELRGS
ncbi:hypothetical protein NJC40_09750 [Pseudomonas sp. 21LCFQ02]|uniref:hypothetical protein n=1 Tax=unclassified Pseudomonas TaxID=196821 RepID=UPI0004F7A308|nr:MULTISPECIES: hypothetical protein [unclassified Pseudomonas]MCO8168058.1 hypothetical protein [Pseudomonas sp. 21LCFQ02]BAP44655.1 putative uncharacterized protein [Pseudomonas sp. StFLB209]